MTLDFLGIAREPVYSPGKVEDDRAILDAVAARLRRTYRVAVLDPEPTLPASAPAPVVFAMCQGPASLETLRRWEASGVRVINSSAGIANTHRARMLAAFERHGIAQPAGRLLRSDEPNAFPEWTDGSAWLKRGDVHATEPDDVVRVEGRAAAATAMAAMRRRGITSALLQPHIDGPVFKFYAVRGCFFAAFAPPQAAQPLQRALETRMRALAEAAAAALELEVFGGDCVRDRQDNLWLIDLNDWPSYARCRPEAAEAIASYLIQTRAK
jgi:hypothetical protein